MADRRQYRLGATLLVNGEVLCENGQKRPILTGWDSRNISGDTYVTLAAQNTGDKVRVVGYSIQLGQTSGASMSVTFTDTDVGRVQLSQSWTFGGKGEGCVVIASPGAYEFESSIDNGVAYHAVPIVGGNLSVQIYYYTYTP